MQCAWIQSDFILTICGIDYTSDYAQFHVAAIAIIKLRTCIDLRNYFKSASANESIDFYTQLAIVSQFG